MTNAIQFNSRRLDWWIDSPDSTQMNDWIWAIYIYTSIYDLPFSKPNWFGHFGRILPSFHRTRFRWPKAGNGTHSSSGYLTSGTQEVPREYFISEYKATHFSSVDDSPKKRTELFASEVGRFTFKQAAASSLSFVAAAKAIMPAIIRSFIHGRVDQLLVIGDGHPTFIRESKPLLMGMQTLTIGLMTIPYSTIQKPHLLLQNSQSALSMSPPRSVPGGHRDFEKWPSKNLWFWVLTSLCLASGHSLSAALDHMGNRKKKPWFLLP